MYTEMPLEKQRDSVPDWHRGKVTLDMPWDAPSPTPHGQQGGMGTHTSRREDAEGDRGYRCSWSPLHVCGVLPSNAGPSTSYLPQRPFFLEHSHHHANGNHQAGQDSHEDAQDLGPGREAVAAVLRGLVLDDVVHQQSL